MTEQKPSPLNSIAMFLGHSKKTILLIIIVATVTLIVSGFVSIILESHNNTSFPSIGNIHAVGVKAYWDPNLQNETKQIQWGTVHLGSSYNVTLYLKSTSNVAHARIALSLATTNWTYVNSNDTIVSGPSDNTPYLNLTWNYDGQTLKRGQILQATLTLTTDDSANFVTFLIDNNIEQFTMDITIQANEK